MKIKIEKRKAKLEYKFIHSTKTNVFGWASEHTILVDSQEQRPWNLRPFQTKSAKLKTGDYQIEGHEDLLVIERKGIVLNDLVGCIGRERDRFERLLTRMEEFEYRYVIVEGSWHDLCAGKYHGKIAPSTAAGTIAAWQVRHKVPFLFAGSRPGAEALAIRTFVSVLRAVRLSSQKELEDSPASL